MLVNSAETLFGEGKAFERIFDLYQVHQENDLLASSLETEQVGLEDEYMVPNLTESVSVDADGSMPNRRSRELNVT